MYCKRDFHCVDFNYSVITLIVLLLEKLNIFNSSQNHSCELEKTFKKFEQFWVKLKYFYL